MYPPYNLFSESTVTIDDLFKATYGSLEVDHSSSRNIVGGIKDLWSHEEKKKESDEMSDLSASSLMPPVEINGKWVIFILTDRPAIHYDKALLHSVEELKSRARLLGELDTALAEKIKIVEAFLTPDKIKS